jgi:hypothetical protein
MLSPGSPVARVTIEHRGTVAVDDVVVEYVPPGVNERGATVGVDYFGLKYHVAQSGSVDHDAVVDPLWAGTKLPLLKRFADTWTQIRIAKPNARLSLVTNWAWDPACPLAPLLRDGGRLDDQFFGKGSRSNVGKIRACWEAATGLSAEDFAAFIRSLRFSTSAVSLADSEAWLRDRCQLAGLVPIAPEQDHSPYDDLGKRLIENGRTEFTPESLRALVVAEGLVATQDPPFRSTFAVRSFQRFAHVPETDGACVIDLTDLFTDRAPRDEHAWATARMRLEGVLANVAKLAQPVHVALDAHLSVAWFAGTLLDPKSGMRVLLRQKTVGKGVELWDVSVPRKPADADGWRIERIDRGEGTDLALIVSVTQDALADATRAIGASLPSVRQIVHTRLGNPGAQSIRDGGEARWLADELIRELNVTVAATRPAHLHVFPACPASLAFLLGQGSHVLGPMTVHEFDFGDPNRGYRAGMSTTTPTETHP